MTQMRLLSIVVLLLLASSIKVCDAEATETAAARKKRLRKEKKAAAAKATQEPKAVNKTVEVAKAVNKTVAVEEAPDAVESDPGPTAGVVTVGGAPVLGGVVPIGGGSGGGLRPYAPAYAGFFCGPPGEGEEGIMEKCRDLPVCKFKRVEDGAVGLVLTGELEDGQGDCMRRCDTRFGMSEEMHCGEGETCHSFIMGCPCDNLTDGGCHPYND
jgi:hypothetical protein